MITVFSTSQTKALKDLAYERMREIADDKRIPITAGSHHLEKFSNGNFLVRIDSSVRDSDVVIFSTQTVELHSELFELLLLISAVKNSKARSLSVVFPYMAYSRSDLKNESRVSVGGQMVADILNHSGVDSVLLIEPHDGHLKQYFKPTADEIPLSPFLTSYISKYIIHHHDKDDWVLVFPDAGAAKRFENIPVWLGIESAVIQKSRHDHNENPQAKRIVGKVAEKKPFDV